MERKVKRIVVVNRSTAGKGTQEGGKERLNFCTLAKARQKGLNTGIKVSNLV